MPELDELTLRIVKGITNPSLSANQKIKQAQQSAAFVRLVADKHHITPEEVQDIIEKYEDRDWWEVPLFDPGTYKTHEEQVFWDFIHEWNMLEEDK